MTTVALYAKLSACWAGLDLFPIHVAPSLSFLLSPVGTHMAGGRVKTKGCSAQESKSVVLKVTCLITLKSSRRV